FSDAGPAIRRRWISRNSRRAPSGPEPQNESRWGCLIRPIELSLAALVDRDEWSELWMKPVEIIQANCASCQRRARNCDCGAQLVVKVISIGNDDVERVGAAAQENRDKRLVTRGSSPCHRSTDETAPG